ncbi:uncharacterized protein LOC131304841 [Rhododendron vialii]|uniref:uncharacterized protein LOC131304841 n=1 Tax=Rhododendron vialii TaxID=182163 RepID=UPI00265F65A6|nr:uncharacterized protein LOC131304841 [Rhododendron vialii]
MFTFRVCFTHKIPRFLTIYRSHKHPLPSISIYLCESVRAGIQQSVSLSKSIVFRFQLRQKMVEQYLLDGFLISIPTLLKSLGEKKKSISLETCHWIEKKMLAEVKPV